MGSIEPVSNLERIWRSLRDDEKGILSYLCCMTQPVSIDTLIALAAAPAVATVNAMEKLKKKKIVYEKEGYGKGTYFTNGIDLGGFLEEHLSKEENQRVLQRGINFYAQSLHEGEDRTLILADLYRRLGDARGGWRHIKKAADILYRSGQIEKTVQYYGYLLQFFSHSMPAQVDAEDFIDSVIEMVSRMSYQLPFYEQIPLLKKARTVAKQYGMWDRLARVTAISAKVLQAAGQDRKASRCFDEFWKLADRIGDPRMFKASAQVICEFLHWKGKPAEAVRRYEEITGGLEEFGDDEETLRASTRVAYCYVVCGRVSRGMGMVDVVRSKAHRLGLQDLVLEADMVNAIILSYIRKIPEAEMYLNRVLVNPDNVIGPHALLLINIIKAHLLCAKGDYEGAFVHHRKGDDRAFPPPKHAHDHIPGYLECLAILESKGFYDEEINCDSEIKKFLASDNPYLKGVALRCRALRHMQRQQPLGRALQDLKKSEKYLKRSGAEIELALTRVALGRYYLNKDEVKTALSNLKNAWEFFSTINKDLFPEDLLAVMPQERKTEFMIDRIIRINESLGAMQDKSSFLERVLNIAMDFTMTTRGAFFSFESGEPKIVVSRNLDPSSLDTERYEQIIGFIANIARKGTECIFPPSEGKDDPSYKALQEGGINAFIAMPVKLGEQIGGYLCLDTRLDGTPFPDNYLPYVRLLCNQMAIGLSNITMYKEMEELKNRLEDQAIFYKREMGVAATLEMIIGASQGIELVLDQIRHVAPTDSSVLVIGETGVGKELVAKAIHNLSERRNGPFIPVNLASLPQELVASELFGHEKGAFTGAHERQKGRFELADGGTIFLDEIGDLPLNAQAKLLRVLQEGTFERLGSAKMIRSDFRVITATNKNIALEIEKGTFRQDLYYRLHIFPIYVPPLRNRKADIPLIARHFIDKYARKMGKRIGRIRDAELKKLIDYHWPGNVRELEHVIERAVILSDGHGIMFFGLDSSPEHPSPRQDAHFLTLADMEREYIEKVLQAARWKVRGPKGAASILGLKSTTLFYRIKKLGIKD